MFGKLSEQAVAEAEDVVLMVALALVMAAAAVLGQDTTDLQLQQKNLQIAMP
jgi:hypothetical protein